MPENYAQNQCPTVSYFKINDVQQLVISRLFTVFQLTTNKHCGCESFN